MFFDYIEPVGICDSKNIKIYECQKIFDNYLIDEYFYLDRKGNNVVDYR